MVAAKTTFVVITEDLTQECVLNLKQSWVETEILKSVIL